MHNEPFVFSYSEKPESFPKKDSLPKQEIPSFLTQAVNFSTSIVKHVAGGMPQTSDNDQEKRLEICRSCDRYNSNDPNNPRCNECGCFLKIKTSWAGESCPLKKWLAVKSGGDCNCNK